MRKLRPSLTRIVMLLAAVAIGYFIFAAAGDVILSQRLNRDEQRLQQEIVELERQEIALQAIRDYLQTDEYIEGVARRTLGLVRPGEALVIVSSSADATPTPDIQTHEADRLWWEKLYGP